MINNYLEILGVRPEDWCAWVRQLYPNATVVRMLRGENYAPIGTWLASIELNGTWRVVGFRTPDDTEALVYLDLLSPTSSRRYNTVQMQDFDKKEA